MPPISRSAARLGIVLALVIAHVGCGNSNQNETLIVFYAASLSLPFKAFAESFEAANPGARVQLEVSGSREAARKITELTRRCDVLVSADYTIIEDLLVPDYADWYMVFARNEVVLAYTEESRYAEEIHTGNWFDVLRRDDVRYARCNPDSAPAGYRTGMVMQLAETYYAETGIEDALTAKDRSFIRPKSADLVALLQTGSVDYVFIYRSEALQRSFQMIDLPGAIDLGNPNYADTYAKAVVEVSGKTPGATVEKRGEPILYALTIPKNAANPGLAAHFCQFLLTDPEGFAKLPDFYQHIEVQPPATFTDSAQVPSEIQSYFHE